MEFGIQKLKIVAYDQSQFQEGNWGGLCCAETSGDFRISHYFEEI